MPGAPEHAVCHHHDTMAQTAGRFARTATEAQQAQMQEEEAAEQFTASNHRSE